MKLPQVLGEVHESLVRGDASEAVLWSQAPVAEASLLVSPHKRLGALDTSRSSSKGSSLATRCTRAATNGCGRMLAQSLCGMDQSATPEDDVMGP